MKPLIFFVLLVVSAMGKPLVGSIVIYNFTKSEVIASSMGKSLTRVAPDKVSSAMLIPAGKRKFDFTSKDGMELSYAEQIDPDETVIIALFSMHNTEDEKSQIKVSKVLRGGDRKLIVQSLCSSPREIELFETQYRILPESITSIPNWKGRDLELIVEGEKVQMHRPGETVAHTLLIWEENEIRSALIPMYRINIPDTLRDDFTFGRSRDEIKGLKTLKPVINN